MALGLSHPGGPLGRLCACHVLQAQVSHALKESAARCRANRAMHVFDAGRTPAIVRCARRDSHSLEAPFCRPGPARRRQRALSAAARAACRAAARRRAAGGRAVWALTARAAVRRAPGRACRVCSVSVHGPGCWQCARAPSRAGACTKCSFVGSGQAGGCARYARGARADACAQARRSIRARRLRRFSGCLSVGKPAVVRRCRAGRQ